MTHPRLQWKSVSKPTLSTKLTWFPRMSELALCGPNPFTVQLLLRRKMPFFQDQVTSTLPRYSSFLWLIQGHLEGRRIREDWQAGGLPLMPQKNFCSRVPQFPSYVRTDVTPPCIIGLSSNCKHNHERGQQVILEARGLFWAHISPRRWGWRGPLEIV